mmetsp:Transcript_47585/g.85045  ORF Transcript_47585/g.85045 Transcript_47585/m.85045 type:complete len:690 (-) Transcript_47585:92-2161(-)
MHLEQPIPFRITKVTCGWMIRRSNSCLEKGTWCRFTLLWTRLPKKEKAEQVTVINQQQPMNQVNGITKLTAKHNAALAATRSSDSDVRSAAASPVSQDRAFMVDAAGNGSTAMPSAVSTLTDQGTKLNPQAREFKPKVMDGSAAEECGTVKSSFLFEHCTGQVVSVSVPTGKIQIDGAPEDAPPISYHYSDVWDDGKCVKQFPRVGDMVSCYIGIDAKTKKEKAENVKVIAKRQQAAEGPARTQVRQTIQNAHYRTAANVAIAVANNRPMDATAQSPVLPPAPNLNQPMVMQPHMVGGPAGNNTMLPNMFTSAPPPGSMSTPMMPHPSQGFANGFADGMPANGPHMGMPPQQQFLPHMQEPSGLLGQGNVGPQHNLPMQMQMNPGPQRPMPYGPPSPIPPPANGQMQMHNPTSMHGPSAMLGHIPPLQHPVPMFPPSPLEMSPAMHPGMHPNPNMSPMATPTKPNHTVNAPFNINNTFAPVLPQMASPARPMVQVSVPTTPTQQTTPTMSPIPPPQYVDSPSPMMQNVARNSPPQSPSPSMGYSLSSNSSIGTNVASCSEVDAIFSGHAPSSPFEPERLMDSADVDALACMTTEATIPDQCRTPSKKNTRLGSTWMSDSLNNLASTPEKSAPGFGLCGDILDGVLPRSPIIGDVLRHSTDEDDDRLHDHDLLSGESALAALHAVSVVDF